MNIDRYSIIEHEMLAVVFGCERFHTYVYAKHCTVLSDHKPLEMIHLKNLAAAPASTKDAASHPTVRHRHRVQVRQGDDVS